MGKGRPYTQEELDFIRENYQSMTYEEIGKIIGRTKGAVQIKATKIGLSKNDGTIGYYEIDKTIEGEPEVWREIPGYDGRYRISNYGRIMSVERKDRSGSKRNEKILKQYIDARGYCRATLSKDMKTKHFQVHTLVAMCFLENPEGHKAINHKDENPRNNFYKNLEYCTCQYNLNYGKHNEKVGRTKGRGVVQYDLNGNKIAEYYSVGDAARQTGIKYKGIQWCCGGYRKRADGSSNDKYAGYKWKYKDEKKKSVRPVLQYDIDGNFIGRFESSADAARSIGEKSCGIKDCCKGLRKTSHGYVWRYESEI